MSRGGKLGGKRFTRLLAISLGVLGAYALGSRLLGLLGRGLHRADAEYYDFDLIGSLRRAERIVRSYVSERPAS